MKVDISARRRKCQELTERYFGHIPSRSKILDHVISDVLRPGDVLLDAGCGCDYPLLSKFGSRTALAVGVDLEAPKAAPCPPVHILLGNLEHIPLAAGSVDVVISHSVVEHLEHPLHAFGELHR